MELKQHYNYVACFQDGRIKIGRTGNLSRRLAEIRREAKSPMFFNEGEPVSARVALHTETHIRRVLRDHALAGLREWFHGPKSDAARIVDFTRETQTALEVAGV